MRISTEGEIPALVEASYNFGTDGIASDPDAAAILTLAQVNGTNLGVTILTHAKPQPHTHTDNPPTPPPRS